MLRVARSWKIATAILYLFFTLLLISEADWITLHPPRYSDETLMAILILLILALTPLIFSWITKIKITKEFMLLWFLFSIIILSSLVGLRNYRLKLIYNNCERAAVRAGDFVAREKNFPLNSDTYYVAFIITAQSTYQRCLIEHNIYKTYSEIKEFNPNPSDYFEP